MVELTAFTLFALNLAITLLRPPAHLMQTAESTVPIGSAN